MGGGREQESLRTQRKDCSNKKGRTEQADALHSLAEPHLVSKNAVLVLVPGVDEPVEAIQLVVPESACLQEVWLALQGPVLELAPGHVRGTGGLQQTLLPGLHSSQTDRHEPQRACTLYRQTDMSLIVPAQFTDRQALTLLHTSQTDRH